MYQQDLKDGYIKRDPWVKAMKKSYDPEEIATLIKKRIASPGMNGPIVHHNSDETATSIVNVFIDANQEYKKKIVPAVGLLLYNLLYEKEQESHELLRGVFNIISNSKLKECKLLLYKWLLKKKDAMHCDDIKWKTTYREGMIAYAYVQDREVEIEQWWYNVWTNCSVFWWSPAFLGMRVSNPTLAGSEIPKLIERNYDKGAYLMASMWSDPASKEAFENAIAVGMKDNACWAGLAVNQVLEKLDNEKKNELMLELKKVIYCA
jgi:hypothetical protein